MQVKLQDKITFLGLVGNIYYRLGDWLKERQQQVVIKGHAYEWSPVIRGVPQGSVLGPVLFIIYRNDAGVRLNNINTKLGKAVLLEDERCSL